MGRNSSFRHPRYQVVRLLAEGGMGKVYLARDLLESDREVALKVYPARFYHERLREEFLALKELHHPGIARALHFGVTGPDRAPFFTLEYVRGKALNRHFESLRGAGRMSAAMELFLSITGAVAYLHRRGILHLDLKPENILVVDAGRSLPPRPVIIDFGLVRAAVSREGGLSHATVPYAPPEAFGGDLPTPASDVYSLAATFYRVLSGRFPVEASNTAAFARAHRTRSAAPVPEAGPALERLLLRALAKDPEKRFRDAGDLHRALVRAAAEGRDGGRCGSRVAVSFHEPDFVGRGPEVAAFLAWLDGGAAERPIFEVSGGGGWGKTRFLEKVQTLLETRGKEVIHIRAAEGGGLTIIQAAARAAAILSPPAARGRRRGDMPDDLSKGARDAPSEDAVRLFSRRVAARLLPVIRGGAFLAVDDVHLASPVEVSFLEEAARGLRTGVPAAGSAPVRGGIVVTRKKPAGGAEEETGWRRAGLAVGLDLGLLALEEALEIDLEGLDGTLSSFSPDRVRSLKTRLHHQAGGHPLFYVRGLLDLAGDPEEAVRLAPTERILAQVSRLERRDHDVAACLALLGRPAEPVEIAGMMAVAHPAGTAGTSEACPGAAEVAESLERLRRLGLAATEGSVARLIHESVAQAAIDGLAADDRRRIHAGIAARLAETRKEGTLAEAAWHCFEARNPWQALVYAERWIDSGGILGEVAGERTVQMLRRAAEGAGKDTPRGCRLSETASDVLESLGRFEESRTERSQLVAAALSGKAPGPQVVRWRRKLGAVCHRAGRIDLAIEHLGACVEPAAEKAAPVDSLRARADLALLHHFRGETELSLEHSRRGVQIWRRSSPADRKANLQSAVNFHAVLGQVCIRRLELDEALRVLKEGLQLSRQIRSPSNTALLLNNLALAHHLSGRLEAALATFREAEAVAKDLEDPAALVSIRSNIAQIHARKGRFLQARAILDEIEESPAVAQSKRLRLWCLYTRGLILSLLGSGAEDIWKSVESLAGETGDSFLARFARIYWAEGLISAGEYSRARAILGGDPDPILEAPRLARLALVEALAGRPGPARAARGRLDPLEEGPPLLGAWNQYYAGVSALETGDLAEARKRVKDARKTFHATGFPVGQIECALVLSDAALRAASMSTRPEEDLALAAEEIDAARKVAIDSPGHVSPRSRDLRTTVLEARIILGKLASRPCKASRKDARGAAREREDAGGRAAGRAALSDLIARAAGDSALANHPDLRVLVECLSAASARLGGDIVAAHDAAERCSKARVAAAAGLDAADRASCLAVDPWRRFGLESFEPPAGDPSLEARHAEGLARILGILEKTDDASQLREALGEIGRVIGAGCMELEVAAERLADWSAGHGGFPERRGRATREQRAGEAVAVRLLSCPLTHRGATVGSIDAEVPLETRLRASDEIFLQAAARAVAPHVVLASGSRGSERRAGARGDGGGGDGRRGAGARTQALDRSAVEAKTESLAETSALRRTQRLTPESLKTGSLARLLRAEGMVATGPEMLKVVRACVALAPRDLPMLVTGDSGTGKNLVARVIHRLSARAKGPFIAQNASAVPPELFEADLFGYERGAFTGAERTRTGFLFQAAGGTFHIEEIGDLDLSLQQRLLRVIEERSVRPLGSTDERRLDVRFIASTQRDLEAMVRRGEFRKDLYYRLNGARIHLPPLSERAGELADLVEHHWRTLTGATGSAGSASSAGSTARFPAAALEALRAHDWPGNVRELVSVLRRLSLETAGMPSAADARAALGLRERRGLFPASLFESRNLEEIRQALEESHLEHLHAKYSGDLEAIATALGTTTRSVYRLFERLGLKPRDLKRPR